MALIYVSFHQTHLNIVSQKYLYQSSYFNWASIDGGFLQ